MAHLDSLKLIWICVVSPSDQNIIWKHEGKCCALRVHVHMFVIMEKKNIHTPPKEDFLVLPHSHPLGNSSLGFIVSLLESTGPGGATPANFG